MNDTRDLELGFLADFVHNAEAACEAAKKYQLTPESFYAPEHAAAFAKLMETDVSDSVRAMVALRTTLGTEAVNNFDRVASVTSEKVFERAYDIALGAYRRRVHAALNRVLTEGTFIDPSSIEMAVQDVLASISKPPIGVRVPQNEEKTSPDETPDALLHVPGFVDALTDFTLRAAFRPKRALAFAGSLVMLAHLMGRLFRDERGTRPNIYLIAIAETGGGKDEPRRTNIRLAHKLDISASLFEQIASGEAIEEMLYWQPVALAQMDEIQTTLASLKVRGNTIAYNIYKFLLTIYGASSETHTLRLKAKNGGSKNEEAISRTVVCPHLSLFGTCIPHGFYEALSLTALENGLVGRCLVVEGGEMAPLARDNSRDLPFPAEVMQTAQELVARRRSRPMNDPAEPETVPFAHGVKDLVYEISTLTDKKALEAKASGDLAGQALWARAAEKVCKLALVYAVSQDYLHPVITKEGVRWAQEFVFHCTSRMCAMVSSHMTSGPTDELCRRVLEMFKRRKKTRLKRSEIARTLHCDSREMDAAEKTLLDRAQIEVQRPTKQSVIYNLLIPLKDIN